MWLGRDAFSVAFGTLGLVVAVYTSAPMLAMLSCSQQSSILLVCGRRYSSFGVWVSCDHPPGQACFDAILPSAHFCVAVDVLVREFSSLPNG